MRKTLKYKTSLSFNKNVEQYKPNPSLSYKEKWFNNSFLELFSK